MKCWHPISSMLMVAALLATATTAQQMTPWSNGQAAGAGAQAASGMPLGGGYANYNAAAYGGAAYGAAAYNGYGAPAYGAQNYAPQPPAVTTVPAAPVQSPVSHYAAPSAVRMAGAPVSQSIATGGAYRQVGCATPVAPGPVTAAPVYTSGAQLNAPCWGAPVVGPTIAPVAAQCPRFFGGVYGLIMDRVDSNNRYFAYDPALPSRLYLSSRDASMNTAGGVEARIGKTFDCCRWGIEAVYWGIFPDDEFASVRLADVPAPEIYTTSDYGDVWLNYGVGPAGAIGPRFNDGSIQTMEIRRGFDYYNLEINFLSGPLTPGPGCCDPCGGCGGGCGGGRGLGGCGRGVGPRALRRYRSNCCQQPRWVAGWLFGFRYFRADEDFLLGVDNGDGFLDYSYGGGDTEFWHQVETENNLYGFQLGVNMNYCFTKCFQLEVGSKFGIFANQINSYQRIFNTTGPAYVSPGTPEDFAIRSSENDIAFLGELRAGLGYKIGCHWRVTGGYRAVAVSNVAEAIDQIPVGRTFGSISHVGDINNDASLILHGAYAGLEFAW